jgi:hypothetical protein
MMSNVVQFPKMAEQPAYDPLEEEVRNTDTGQKYLKVLKNHLSTDDYEEILLAIMDEDYYYEADQQLKDIVDCYFRYAN